MVLNVYSEGMFLIIVLKSCFSVVLCSRKHAIDVLISVDVFALDRTVRGIIFSLLVKFFIETVDYKHIRLFLHSLFRFLNV